MQKQSISCVKHLFRRIYIGSLTAALVAVISSCGAVKKEHATVRVVNLAADIGSVDLFDGDSKILSSIAPERLSGYVDVDTDERNFKLKSTGGTNTLLERKFTPVKDINYSLVYAGIASDLKVYTLNDSVSQPASGKARLRVLNAVTGGASYDVFVTAEATSLQNATPTIASVAAGNTSTTADFDQGNYRVRVTSGSGRSVLYDARLRSFADRSVATLVLYSGKSSQLAKGVFLNGNDSDSFDSSQSRIARLRLANGSLGNTSLSVRADGQLLFGGIPNAAASSYLVVDSGSKNYVLEGNQPAIQLATVAQNLIGGEDYTMLAIGVSPNVNTSLLLDNNVKPRAGYARLRAINGVSDGGNADVLIDYRKDFSAIAPGSASSNYLEYLPATNFRIGASFAQGSQSVFDFSTVELKADQGYSILLAGGVAAPKAVLVNDR